MNLANPFLFALGLTAVALPLWIHLRRGRIRRRAVVGSLQLLRAAPQSSRRPRRVVDWPLLLLRALIVLLLALGFGRLLVPALDHHDRRSYAVIVVDRSGSMRAGLPAETGEAPTRPAPPGHGDSSWEQARAKVEARLRRLDPSSRVALVESPAGSTQPGWESPRAALARLRGLEPGHAANRLADAVETGRQLLAAMPDDRPKSLAVISDFQRSSLAGMDRVALPAGWGLELDPVRPAQAFNRGLSVSVLQAGATTSSFYGFADLGSGSFQLTDSAAGVQPMPAPQTVEIPAGQAGVAFEHAGPAGQWQTRGLALDQPDGLAADDRAWDSFRPQPPIGVWLWEPPQAREDSSPRNPAGTGAPLRSLLGAPAPPAPTPDYERPTYYWNRALQPGVAGGLVGSRYHPQLLDDAGLVAARERLGQADPPRLLLVAPAADYPEDLGALARELLARGGSVLIAGGPGLDSTALQRRFGELLPLRPGAEEATPAAPALEAIAASHPLWGGLDAGTRLELTRSPLRQRHAVAGVPAETTVLARYRDGTPLVACRAAGPGQVLFLNTSLDRSWGDWPASAPRFLPAVHQLVAFTLGLDRDEDSRAPLLAGVPATLTLPAALAGQRVRLDGREFSVAADGRVEGLRADRPGLFELTDADGGPLGPVAVNFPPAESALEAESVAVLQQRLHEANAASSQGAALRWDDPQRGNLGWQAMLFAAAALLLAEPFVADRRQARATRRSARLAAASLPGAPPPAADSPAPANSPRLP